MSDPSDLPYWRLELDDGCDRVGATAKCANCDLRVHPTTLSADGLCELCVDAAKADDKALRAEAGRTP